MSDLVKVLEHYGLFTGEAKYKIICPFHGDKNASLLIDIHEDRWHCFGCTRSGSGFDFIKYAEPQLGIIDQYKLFYRILGGQESSVKIKMKSPKQVKREKRKDLLAAKDFYFNLSTVDWNDPDEDMKYMLDRGFEPRTLNKVKAKITYNQNYPIVLPMNDMGKFRGWVCRTTNPEIEKKRKYLYNKGFSRLNTIVGKYDNEVVMLVEGFMDYLKAKQFGMKYVGAILGWKITENQIKKLKKQGVKYIISALDNDQCGKDGTKLLKEHFKVQNFKYIKGVKDIGEMTQEQFDKCYTRTKKLFRKKKRR